MDRFLNAVTLFLGLGGGLDVLADEWNKIRDQNCVSYFTDVLQGHCSTSQFLDRNFD